jgi:ElaB/YqjD/DUF883 family membrane-anchored ribosome-binding protein
MGMKKRMKKFGRDLQDRRKQEKVKKAVKASLKKAMIKIRQVERKLKDPRTRERAKTEMARLKAKVCILKTDYKKAERKAVRYTQENPKRALAIAAAVGVLAGTLLSAFRSVKKRS